jgi:hypothetical protein
VDDPNCEPASIAALLVKRSERAAPEEWQLARISGGYFLGDRLNFEDKTQRDKPQFVLGIQLLAGTRQT